MLGVRSASLILVTCIASSGTQSIAADAPDYVKQIKPLMQKYCVSCHGEDDQESGLRLDYASLLIEGGDRGATVKSGDPDASLMVKVLHGTKGIQRMPLDQPKLSDANIDLIKLWIKAGAKIPAEDKPTVGRRKSDHWAFQPIVRHQAPADNSGWSRNAIDRFVLAKLAAENLKPSSEADKVKLIRRVYLDLLGILPTPDDVGRFVADTSPDAYEQLVDRVLASPAYGERWGRHWLDIARYADSNGFTIDGARSIWPFRDWVIRAFNSNMSYRQFVTDQLAGDLLPNATRDQLVATGFHRNTLINQEGGTDKEQFRIESIVDRVNTTGATFLGLTIGCAQCHMHKYDPITQREYYRIFAVFNTCDEPSIPLPSTIQQSEQTRIKTELASINARLKAHTKARSTGQPAWEKDYGAQPKAKWNLLSPTEFVSKAGATINKLDEHSLIVGGNGNIPSKDTYTIKLDIPAGKTTAIRLEALTNKGLPKDGPGLVENGNFVLSEIAFSQANAAGKQIPIPISRATVDWQQEGYSIEQAFDGNTKTGWAVGGVKVGSPNVNREAIFVLSKPINAAKTTQLQIVIQHNHNVAKYLLGCMRFSSTSASTDTPLVPVNIQSVLAIGTKERTAAHKTELASAYARTDESRRPLVAQLNKLKGQESRLKSAIPTTMVLREQKKPRPTHIHIRGNFLEKGAIVKTGVPAVLPPMEFADESSANRLDFANWLFDPQHPLTSRVTVNRFWQRFFGLGLVETENDFGTQGNLPTHPKLLDWLASEFIRLDWNIKSLHRLIVTSATYRQSSHVTKSLYEKDPRNRLLARQSRIRLEAEGIRDLALSVSGALSQKMLGPGVYPPQPKGIYVVTQVSKQWPESKGLDRYRRGLYTFFWRSSPYPMLPTFDAPDANGTCTKRTRSNTPLQALTLANDGAFMELAKVLSDRILKESPDYTEGRIRFAMQVALSREPSKRETEILTRFVEQHVEFYQENQAAAKAAASSNRAEKTKLETSATWTAVARVLLNLDEFITRE
jgi:mono/diheme cytochrome c family protein